MNLFGDTDSEVEPFGADLVAPAPILEARITETTFDGILKTPLKLHEDLARGCGGQIWPAGECLSKYVLKKLSGDDVKGKRIVELGAGGGIVGLVLFKRGDGLLLMIPGLLSLHTFAPIHRRYSLRIWRQ